jgi:hypothetical protein
LWQHPAAQKRGNLKSINPVVLGFAAMDRFHVQRVPEDERDSFLGAEIRKPVPGENALRSDDESFTIGRNRLQEELRPTLEVLMEMDLAGLVKHAKVHGSDVQIDAAVKFVLLGVESHRFPLVNGLNGQPPATPFGIGTGGALMSINALQLTKPAQAMVLRS